MGALEAFHCQTTIATNLINSKNHLSLFILQTPLAQCMVLPWGVGVWFALFEPPLCWEWLLLALALFFIVGWVALVRGVEWVDLVFREWVASGALGAEVVLVIRLVLRFQPYASACRFWI